MSNKFWMGSDESHEAALAAIVKCEDYKSSRPKADYGEEDNPDFSPYLSVVDNVGIVTVQGSLLDGEYGVIGTYFGVTGYGDVQKALVAAVRNSDVKSILLVIKSGGGAVSGVSETAKFIESVDKVKPVIAYSPSTIASAALWMGLAARETYISSTTVAGSIGTITVMASYYKKLQSDGVDTEVIRSGKYKALGNSAEPISDLAKEETQKTVNYLSDVFLSYVADRRKVSKVSADTRFGQGRTFIGQQAVDVGLVDGISSYTQAFVSTKSRAAPDNSRRVVGATIDTAPNTVDNANQLEGNLMHIPTTEQLAAMAAGVDLNQNAAIVADSGEAAENKVEAISVELLNAQLSEANEKLKLTSETLAALTVESETFKSTSVKLQETLDAQVEVVAGLTDIVKTTIKTMAMPFNLETGALAELTGQNLLAKHKEVSDLFKSKIKAGGVAAAARETKEEAEKPNQMASVNPLFLAAAQLNSRKGK